MGHPGSHLLAMPLHAITEVLGEEGLRERFALEVRRAFDPDDQRTLRRALALASTLHRDDRRVREPYVNHLLRVAIRVMCYYHVRDVDVVVAALLHDSVEDHAAQLAAPDPGGGLPPTDVAATAFAVLAEQFNPRVAELVAAVTNPPFDDQLDRADRHDQYRRHVAESLARNPWARVIKVSDFTDNGAGLIHMTGPKLPQLAAKYRPLVPVLRELIGRPDTPLTADVKRHIFSQLSLADDRLTAIAESSQSHG